MSQPLQADRRRLLFEGLAVVALTAIAAWLRLDALGRLSLDGDDGFTALAASGVLEHGVPELPAGVVYWKSLLYTYLAAGAQQLFGPGEWVLRLPDAVASTVLVPVGWWVARRCFGPAAALATAAVLALHLWGVEMGRHARYYALLQVMVLLFVERFHRVHVQGVGRARPTLILAFVGALLAHTIALSLVALYGPVLLADRTRLLRDRGVLAEGAGVAAVVVGWLAFESSWEVGFVTRPEEGALSAVGALLGGYSTALVDWWPALSPRLIALAGAAALAAAAARLARRPLPEGARMLWILAVGTATILAALGFGQANHQPRYLFFTFPLVVLVAFGGVRVAVGALASGARRPTWMPSAAVLVALVVLAPDLRIRDALRVPARLHATPIVHTQFLPSTTKRFSWDHAVPNRYVAEHRRPGDRVFGMHPIFTHHYAGGLDGWIWRGDPGTWDAYHDQGGRPYDNYVGVPLMRTLGGLLEQLVLEPGRVWVVTTPSVELDAHVDGRIRSFLERQPEARVVNGRDGLSGVYLWEDGVGAAGPEPYPFWEVERMPGLTGRIEVDPRASRGAVRTALAGRDPAGVLSHGPYRVFPAGRYEARFHLAGGGGARARVEVVVATVGTPLAEREVELDREEYRGEALPVELEEPTELELRIVWEGSGELRADRVELVPLDAGPREIRVLAAGDSITELNYPPFLGPLLDDALERPVVLVNGGRSGNTTREYLAHLMHGNLLPGADPDWVLLQLGTNDVRVDSDHTELEEFERNLEALLRLIALHRNGRGRAPEVLLGTVPPLHAHPRPFDADSPRRIVDEINPAIRRIAREHGLALSDPFERLEDPALFPDGIHPDDAGSRVIAESWAATLVDRIAGEP